MYETIACNLCHSTECRTKFESQPADTAALDKAHFVPSTDAYGEYGRIVKCLKCGLVYTNPRPKDTSLLENYQGFEDHDYMDENASRSINAYMSLNTIRQYVPSGKLLDVGCSTGYFLNAARLDFETFGVEPSEWASNYAREKLRLDFFTGTLEAAKFSTNQFDVVSMSDVIEHVPDPRQTLKEVHRVIKPGGILYMVTPDVGSITAKILGSKWWGLRPAHVYYFSRKTMRQMLEEEGFEVIHLGSFGRVFRLAYWISRLNGYSPTLTEKLVCWSKKVRLGNKLVYINTFDSMEVCARKR